MIRLAAVGIVALALGLAACGEDVIDQDSLEKSVLGLAPDKLQAESASCPDDVSPEAGTEFECTVTTANGDLTVTAEVTSKGDEDVQFKITDVVRE